MFVCLFYTSTFSWEPRSLQEINNLCKVTEGENCDLPQGSTIIAFFLPLSPLSLFLNYVFFSVLWSYISKPQDSSDTFFVTSRFKKQFLFFEMSWDNINPGFHSEDQETQKSLSIRGITLNLLIVLAGFTSWACSSRLVTLSITDTWRISPSDAMSVMVLTWWNSLHTM